MFNLHDGFDCTNNFDGFDCTINLLCTINLHDGFDCNLHDGFDCYDGFDSVLPVICMMVLTVLIRSI